MLNSTNQQRYVSAIRIYINHKKVLEKHSTWYKKEAVAKSMSKCWNVLQLVKSNCREYNIRLIAKMVLQHKDDLMMILPAPNNPTYLVQKQKIENLIQISQQYAAC